MVINFSSLTFVLQSYIPVMFQATGFYLRENACHVCLQFYPVARSLTKSKKGRRKCRNQKYDNHAGSIYNFYKTSTKAKMTYAFSTIPQKESAADTEKSA